MNSKGKKEQQMKIEKLSMILIAGWIAFSIIGITVAGYYFFNTFRMTVGGGNIDCPACDKNKIHKISQANLERLPKLQITFENVLRDCTGYHPCENYVSLNGFDAIFAKDTFGLDECNPQGEYCGTIFYEGNYYNLWLEMLKTEFGIYVIYGVVSGATGSATIAYLLNRFHCKG